jgi:hypothetical protein
MPGFLPNMPFNCSSSVYTRTRTQKKPIAFSAIFVRERAFRRSTERPVVAQPHVPYRFARVIEPDDQQMQLRLGE